MEASIHQLLAYKGVAVGLWFALLFAGERLLPAAATSRGWFGDWPRLAGNTGFWLINGLLSLAVVVPVSHWAADIDLGLRPAWLGGWTGAVVDLVLLDFLIYWWHRANHTVPFLWRFHEVHHLDQFLDTTSAVRFHFGEVLLSAGARAVVIVLFAIPLASVLVFEALVLAATLFHHSNLRLPAGLERVLSWIVVTPSIHWVHHHAEWRDTNANYSTVLSLWDRLFGSRSPTRRAPTMTIGTPGRHDLAWPRLVASPFQPRARG
jgi:sterol desaturase/sphingolipid hydroxylase (fatty acid hydroxylase superfamily)